MVELSYSVNHNFQIEPIEVLKYYYVDMVIFDLDTKHFIIFTSYQQIIQLTVVHTY